MKNKVFIGNLPWHTTTDDLVTFLQGMGYEFRSANVITDRETGRSRGFAFVEFSTPEGAAQAIENLPTHAIDGRCLLAAQARERSNRQSSDGGVGRVRWPSPGREPAGDDGDEGYRG